MQTIAGLQTCNCATHLERIFLRWSNDHQALQPIPVERIMICAVGTCKLVFSLGQREKAFPSLSSSTCGSCGNRQYQLATSCCHILDQGRLHQSQHQWMSVRKQLVTRCPSFTYFTLSVPPFPPIFSRDVRVNVKLLKLWQIAPGQDMT